MRTRTKKALTLVELLAALAITSLLVVAALRVSTHLARAEILTCRTREDAWFEARLQDLVEEVLIALAPVLHPGDGPGQRRGLACAEASQEILQARGLGRGTHDGSGS